MTEYALTAPLCIGPRLMPAVIVAQDTDTYGTISAQISGYDERPRPRAKISYFIDFPGGEYYGNDISVSPLYTDDKPGEIIRRGMATLCGFLTAEAEAYRATMGEHEPADGFWLFSAEVAEWAYLNSDELAQAELELKDDNED